MVAAGTTLTADIKLITLLQEAFRHCKPLAAWGDGAAVLNSAGISGSDAGVQIADQVDRAFTDALVAAVGMHRVWDHAPAVMASAVPPSKKR